MLTYKTCRVCNNPKLDHSGRLGMLPQINYCSPDPKEAVSMKEKLPINLYFCEHCYHFQLGESFSPEDTFETYSYATQYTPSIKKHGNRIVEWFRKKYNMPKQAFIVEIASSDGAILRSFMNQGYKKVMGIEPAKNIARLARSHGIPTKTHFFSRAYAKNLSKQQGQADVVLARNVLAHVPETVDFLQGIRELLKPEGIFCVETPYGRNLIEYTEFDSMYHEHLSYYLVSTLKYLFGRAGLEIIDIEETTMHTGSIAVFAKRIESARPVSPKVTAFIEQEKRLGYFDKKLYRTFIQTCKKHLKDINAYISALHKQGGPLAGYGAAAKANVLINLLHLTPSTINFIVDRNPIKYNTWAPGSGIPIKPVQDLAASDIKHVILFAWNFADEILMENKHLLDAGKQFHVLIPKPMPITLESIKKKDGFKFYRSLES